MLRSEATGQRLRAAPWREQEWKESEDRDLWLDATERMRAFDDMLQRAFDEMLQHEADDRRVSGIRGVTSGA